MNDTPPKQPEHQAVYNVLREKVLFGDFLPGRPLTILGLAEEMKSSTTPIREAIRRLTAEGAFETLENRRFAIPDMTAHRLEQIELVRLVVEPELARRGAYHINNNGIAELEDLDEQINDAINTGDIYSYLEANYHFHFTLYRAAQSHTLYQIAASLWLQIGPSLRTVCGRFGTAYLRDKQRDKHFETTEALRKRDIDTVALAIHEDISQGLNFVREVLPKS